ncbi:hypothetical protein BCAR13_1560035 [Paraburkholderia caribensis]|nr:hypothetical protein BCAR13_1560035 [Paraburkholderia caribensis]
MLWDDDNWFDKTNCGDRCQYLQEFSAVRRARNQWAMRPKNIERELDSFSLERRPHGSVEHGVSLIHGCFLR